MTIQPSQPINQLTFGELQALIADEVALQLGVRQ